MKIGKRYTFQAAHHLPNYNGKCENEHGHGYVVWVEVESEHLVSEGPSDGGMVLDFAELDETVKPLLEVVDHTDLNISLGGRGVLRPTAERVCQWFATEIDLALRLHPVLRDVKLSRVRLYETERAYAEWTA